ncbi:MAG: hypothetical protein Q7S14_03680 [bacterium]|nr:hypothetical protein [bacterium]
MKFLAIIPIIVLALAGYFFFKNQQLQKPKVGTVAKDETASWKTYKNNKFNIGLNYPVGWSKPDVEEHNNGFSLIVGTGAMTNSYHITFQYAKRPDEIPIDKYISVQWGVQREIKLLELSDGESTTSEIYTLTKVRDVQLQNYKGVEFISSIPDTAGAGSITDWKFNNTVRKVLLINDNYDLISIVGSPKDLDLTGGLDKKTVSQKVDGSYLNEFKKLVNSVEIVN